MRRPIITRADAWSLLMILDSDWRASLERDGLGAEIPKAERAIRKLARIEGAK